MKFVFVLTMVAVNLSFTSFANEGKTLVLSRTISQLVSNENQKVVTLSENGTLAITFPQGYVLYKNPIQQTILTKKQSIAELFNSINTAWTSHSIENSVHIAKSNKQNSLFYSSDPDFFELSLHENGVELWKVNFNNREEIKHLSLNNQNLFQLNQLLNTIDELTKAPIAKAIKEIKK